MIRVATILDVDKIIEIAEHSFKIHYKSIISEEQIEYMYEKMYSKDSIIEQFKEGKSYILYFEDANPIGFASYFFKEDGGLYLSKLYVKYEFKGKKIGSQLMSYIEKIGLKKQSNYIELNVNRKNESMYFYKAKGFELYEKVDIAYGKFWLNDYVLRKQLKSQ